MSEFEPTSSILGSEKLTAIFGRWPSFHDAEVIEFSLWRGNVSPEKEQYTFPVLTTKIHLWEMTDQVGPEGQFILTKSTLATLRFHDVHDIEMEGFNHQNAILDLAFGIEPRGLFTNGEPLPPYITVQFEPAFGLSAFFKCFRVEVVAAEPYPLREASHA